MSTIIGRDRHGNTVQFEVDARPVEIDESATVVTIGATSFTIKSEHNDAVLYFTSGSAVTLNVPTGLGAGFQCGAIQGGAGTVTPTTVGTTIHNRQSQTGTAGQYALISLVAVAADVFVLGGDTA